LGDSDGELVTAEANQGVAGHDDVAEPFRDGDEVVVAGGAAQAGVDGFEAVGVAERCGQWSSRRRPKTMAPTNDKCRTEALRCG
jgi:hypothetical protein